MTRDNIDNDKLEATSILAPAIRVLKVKTLTCCKRRPSSRNGWSVVETVDKETDAHTVEEFFFCRMMCTKCWRSVEAVQRLAEDVDDEEGFMRDVKEEAWMLWNQSVRDQVIQMGGRPR